MPLEPLPHDEWDIALLLAGTLPSCPFCGGRAATRHAVNLEPTFARAPVYRSAVFCTGSGCGASLGHNAASLQEARDGAVERWRRRP